MGKLSLRVARAFVPSWRFFDEIDPAPKLFYRATAGDSPDGPWLPVVFEAVRGWTSLVFNAEGNLALARHALLEQLLGDVAEPSVRESSAVEALGSYSLVAQLVREQLLRRRVGTTAAEGSARLRFQFKITVVDPAQDQGAAEDVLVSGIHEV